jgi:tetratricopeptide (TPR) repeat protein
VNHSALRTVRRAAAAVALLLSASAAPALADTVWAGSGAGRGLEFRDAKITKVDLAKEVLVFDNQGRSTERPLSTIKQLAADNEQALNAAEEAFFAAKYDQAVEGYQRALRASSKEWVKTWAAYRLADAANQAGRFDAAVSAYVQLVRVAPNLAAKLKPQLPSNVGSKFVDDAIVELTAAARGAGMGDPQKQAIYTLLMEVQRAKGDTAGAAKTLEELTRLNVALNPNDPAAQALLAETRLAAAESALDGKKYAEAVKIVEDNRAAFNEPAQQARALFVLAEAQFAQAKKDDKQAMSDAALAYMRVAAHFRDAPGKPHVAESLLKTASILEGLGADEKKQALSLYQQIATEFANEPQGAEAKKAAERLQAAQ